MSCYIMLARPPDIFHLFGSHSVQHLVHLLPFILTTCLTPFHFFLKIVYSMMSIIFVLFLNSEHGTLSYSFKLNIFLTIAL